MLTYVRKLFSIKKYYAKFMHENQNNIKNIIPLYLIVQCFMQQLRFSFANTKNEILPHFKLLRSGNI